MNFYYIIHENLTKKRYSLTLKEIDSMRCNKTNINIFKEEKF